MDDVILLGRDFLSGNKANMDFSNDVLTLKPYVKVKTNKNLTVQARSQAIVTAYTVGGNYNGKDCLIKPDRDLSDLGLVAATSMWPGFCTVLNSLNKDIVIRQNTMVAEVNGLTQGDSLQTCEQNGPGPVQARSGVFTHRTGTL